MVTLWVVEMVIVPSVGPTESQQSPNLLADVQLKAVPCPTGIVHLIVEATAPLAVLQELK